MLHSVLQAELVSCVHQGAPRARLGAPMATLAVLGQVGVVGWCRYLPGHPMCWGCFPLSHQLWPCHYRGPAVPAPSQSVAATPTHNHRRACLRMKVFVCCASREYHLACASAHFLRV